MRQLLISKCDALFDENKKDTQMWSEIYNVINLNVSLVDRCEYVSVPYKFKLYEKFRMPTDLRAFDLTYEQCCEKRAWEMIGLSRSTGKPIALFYSGGIDSTLMLISFIKILSEKELRERIVVCLTPLSIYENPEFYYNTVRKKCTIQSSMHFTNMFNKKYLVLGGEHNDQLFGSDVLAQVLSFKSFDYLLQPYEKDFIVDFFIKKGLSKDAATMWFDLIDDHIKNAAPCEVKTVYDFFWWLNFCFKWQCVYFRMLVRISPLDRHLIDQDFVDNHFYHFYSSTYFQKWSMLNRTDKIQSDWKSYKLISKKLIYDFDKNDEYFKNKTKRGSLSYLFRQVSVPEALTDNYEFLDKVNPAEFYLEKNSFNKGE